MDEQRIGSRFFGRKKKGPGRNKKAAKRLSLETAEPFDMEGGGLVVKGVSKRIIVVKSPDPRIFEQAIFIIREDFAGQAGVTEKEVLREARRAANSYLGGGSRFPGKFFAGFRAPLYAAAGAAATGLAWLAVNLIHF